MHDLFDHWAEEPPLSVVVRALAGWEPQTPENDPATPKVVTQEEWDRMVGAAQVGAKVGAQRLAQAQHGR
jgi:hypothetical protein